jgi:hypothetical protein
MSPKFATIFTKNVKKNWYHIYIYDLLLDKYLGYIDLLSFIDFKDLDSTVYLKTGFEIDFIVQDSIIICCLDSVFIVGYNKLCDQWQLLKRVEKVGGIDPSLIKEIKMLKMGH